ncbi:hypothetical protein C350_06172 [Cryptococcus neoformans MW-RSA36]|nr:hypothetical protein C350_06172 [Cryptococcus neoformans var. grubii MW-RSA36]
MATTTCCDCILICRPSVSIAFLFTNPFFIIHPSIHPSVSLNNTSCSTVLKSQHYKTHTAPFSTDCQG